jgi:uncharacterized protein YfaQ (DUF2300 family)
VLIELTGLPTELEAACVNKVIRVTSTTAKPKIHLGLRIERPMSVYDMSDLDSDGMTMVTARREQRRTRTLTSAWKLGVECKESGSEKPKSTADCG